MSGQVFTTGSVTLFGVVLAVYIYFAPTLIALMRAHPRFWVILALNVPAALLHSFLLPMIGITPHAGLSEMELYTIALVVVCGPVWLGLAAWALWKQPRASEKLVAWRDTKTYDMMVALPLIAWFLESAMRMRPNLAFLGSLILSGQADSLMVLQFVSLGLSALFCLLCVWLLLLRDKPILRTQGLLPRLAALAGTFLAVGMLRLQVPVMSLFQQATVFLLIGLGTLAGIVILARLGKSFSIMPEARNLVTSGPYAYARHPLYAAEMVILLGMILQYEQPWALLMGGATIGLQVIRALYEERVLARAFPDYEAYKARTKRFIPGVI